jgi:hypothetical protein
MLVHHVTRQFTSNTIAVELATYSDVVSFESTINADTLFIGCWASVTKDPVGRFL